MAHTILALAALPSNIEALTNAELVALCEEPEFLAQCTPRAFKLIAIEMIVRLGAEIEVNSGIESELLAEVDRLAQYEPAQVTAARQEASRKTLDALITATEAKPKGRQVKVATS